MIAIFFLLLLSCLGLVYQFIDMSGFLIVNAYFLLSWCLFKKKLPYFFQSIVWIVFLLFSAALFFHKLPGFHNFKIFNGIYFCALCSPYTLYVNFDKPLIALVAIAFGIKSFWPIANWWNTARVALIATLTAVVILICTGWSLHFIRLDVKFPNETFLWAGVNLFLVCLPEEILFRSFLQKLLTDSLGKYLALGTTAILFGLAHFSGGMAMIVLSTIAGFIYGMAYLKSGQRLEAAVATHFMLNFIHFIFFSYPSFQG